MQSSKMQPNKSWEGDFMKKKIASYICISLAMGILLGCADKATTVENDNIVENNLDTQNITNSSETIKENISQVKVGGLDDFDEALITFIETEGMSNQNYMISPTSYKAALTLAVAGADNETKNQLLDALGYKNIEDLNSWYNSIQDSDVYTIANSVWHNLDYDGAFTDYYIDYVYDSYNAFAKDVTSSEITESVNKWVNDETNGQIQSIAPDLSEVDMLLANALYLKTAWKEPFLDNFTYTDLFETYNGEKVKKEFMQQTSELGYYEDKNGKLVILPMNGGIKAVFILGEIEDINKAIDSSEWVEVDVKLPKLNMDSEFDSNYLVEFLKELGVELPFKDDGSADFSIMCADYPMYISDIIQKTHIDMDEEGIEASAVTVVEMMEATALDPYYEEPKEFYADKPFKFFLYTETDNKDVEILFFGQVVE